MKPADVACVTCRQPSVVVINDLGACIDHIDDALAPVAEQIRVVTELAHAAAVADALRRSTGQAVRQ